MDEFKRANFFPGLQVGPTYWNSIADYHFRKEGLYNALFHGVGVVDGCLGSLQVQVERTKGGLLALLIDAGLALDGIGHPLLLYQPQTLVLDIKKFKLPTTVYIIIKYDERFEDFYQNRDNLELQGYQKRLETAKVDIVDELRDPDVEIELARIRLEEDERGGVTDIRDNNRYSSPERNMLDYRFVPYAASVRAGVSPQFKACLVELTEYTQKVAASAYEVLPIVALQNLYTYALSATMTARIGALAGENVAHLMRAFFELDYQALFAIVEYERDHSEQAFRYTTKDSYKAARAAMHTLGDQLTAYQRLHDQQKNHAGPFFPKPFGDEIDGLLQAHRLVMEQLWQTLSPTVKRVTLEEITTLSALPQVLHIGDERYTQVDMLDLGSLTSIESHQCKILGTSHPSTSHEDFCYPDGTQVSDTVKRWVEGALQFQPQNTLKGHKTLIIRRTDMYHGDYAVEVTLEGTRSRTLQVEGADTKNRWRNLVVRFADGELPAQGNAVSFAISDGRDNSGMLWVYQAL
ncbi:MAG: hypothetical protein LBS86_06870 [Treponema sp.]|jgi:hypothetical protein|nr:hypothetical protein [Treponema sp.]